MYQAVAQTTRILAGIMDSYDHQFHFEVSRHYCAMWPQLSDGSMNEDEEVETLPFRPKRLFGGLSSERWAQAEVEQRKQQGKRALTAGDAS